MRPPNLPGIAILMRSPWEIRNFSAHRFATALGFLRSSRVLVFTFPPVRTGLALVTRLGVSIALILGAGTALNVALTVGTGLVQFTLIVVFAHALLGLVPGPSFAALRRNLRGMVASGL